MTQIEKAVLPVSEAGTGTGAQALPVDLGTLLAAADPARGESVGKVCASCHTFEQGGPNRTGPNLWGIVGRPVASAPGFAYSDALAGHPGAWTYEQLAAYPDSPAPPVPGNTMRTEERRIGTRGCRTW